jgi:hypothetical protein
VLIRCLAFIKIKICIALPPKNINKDIRIKIYRKGTYGMTEQNGSARYYKITGRGGRAGKKLKK